MEENRVLENVSKALTQESIKVEIPIVAKGKAHAFLQKKKLLPVKKLFEVRPITLGNLARISKLLLPIELANVGKASFIDDSTRLMSEHSRVIAEVMAIAVTNSKNLPPKKLVDFLFYNLSSHDMIRMVGVILQQMGMQDFIVSITSIKGWNVLNTAGKKEVSQ